MDSVILKNVRCFGDPGPIPLAPLTFLVGENSSGKSTFLASIKLAAMLSRGAATPDFNEAPFKWGGSFDAIVNDQISKNGAKEFAIGFGLQLPQKLAEAGKAGGNGGLQLRGTFKKAGTHPFLKEWSLHTGRYAIITTLKTPTEYRIKVKMPGGETSLSAGIFGTPLNLISVLNAIKYNNVPSGEKDPFAKHAGHRQRLTPLMEHLVNSISTNLPPLAFAPIRTAPKRFYDPLQEIVKPTGSHFPMVLARISAQAEEWKELEPRLKAFGQESGLFAGIEVKRPSGDETDSFQILIQIAGSTHNLIDVGYGVSQILPMVFDILRAPQNQMFLLQQPEVHLHPRAQAAFSSLLGQLVSTQKKRFVVETHSDYILDRIRIDISEKKSIKPEDVLFLYFERDRKGVQVYPIRIDSNGNLVDVPIGYRQFFLDEQMHFLGV